MCQTGGNTSLTSSQGEDYLAEGTDSFLSCKKYDETITIIKTSKAYDVYLESRSKQQLVKNYKGINRILVVDDEHDISFVLRLVLEGSGFAVDVFNNPLTALQNFRTASYDLAILDVKMPVLNGFGLYQQIRKLDDKVKICFLTAATDFNYEALGKQFANIDEKYIIRKPIENESLIQQIKSILQ
jgi:CheY-like chemotaxis protein